MLKGGQNVLNCITLFHRHKLASNLVNKFINSRFIALLVRCAVITFPNIGIYTQTDDGYFYYLLLAHAQMAVFSYHSSVNLRYNMYQTN